MKVNGAFVVGTITGSAVIYLMSWWVGAQEVTDPSSSGRPDELRELRPRVEPEPNPQRSGLLHQASIPKRDLLRDLRNASTNGEKLRIVEQIGQARLPDAVPFLADVAELERGSLRNTAIIALGQIGTSEATDVLIGLSESPRRNVRSQALQALGRSGNPNAIAWLKEIADSNLLRMGPSALHAIAQLGDDSHVSYFVGMMRRNQPELSSAAAEALAKLGSQRARNTLIRLAQEEGESSVRLSAIRGLGTFDHPNVHYLLRKLIGHEHHPVAMAAIESYALVGSENVVRTLTDIAQKGRRSLQSTATLALAATGSIDARDELINILFSEDIRTMDSAARALAEIGDDESIKALTDGLQGGRQLVFSVLRAMEKAPTNEEMTQALSNLVRHGSPESSVAAGRVLIIHTGDEAIPTLLEALKKFRPYQQGRLCNIIARIEGDAATQALLELVRGGSKFLQVEAVSELINHNRLSPNKGFELVINQLNRVKDAHMTKRLVRLLAKLNHPKGDEYMLSMITSDSTYPIESILSAISSEGSPQLLGNVIQHIREMSQGKRRQRMIASLPFDRPESREFLRDIASGSGKEAAAALTGFSWHAPHEVRDIAYRAVHSDDYAMRVSAVRVLRGINGPEEINALNDLLKDTNSAVKEQVVEALGRNDEPYAKDVLMDAFETGDTSLRLSAAYHLAESKHPRSIDLLMEAALSGGKDSSVFYHAIEHSNSQQAHAALKRIKELVPDDNEDLKAAILDSELKAEELAAFESLRVNANSEAFRFHYVD